MREPDAASLGDADLAPLQPETAVEPVTLREATVGEGLVLVMRDLTVGLLGWTAEVRNDMGTEAVHQARVATRRLRSALSIYRRVHPTLRPLAEDVRHCAAALGAVRDWDVFLSGIGGTLAALDDPRVGRMLRAATARREAAAAALADYLAGADFQRLRYALDELARHDDALDSDDGPDEAGTLAIPTPAFAAAVLNRRLKRVRRRGRSLHKLPTEALHELRKDCKRLRYAAEFFAPAFPGRPVKPLLRRLAGVQAHLGTLNDAASCDVLVAQLGRTGRGYAGGLAAGLALAATAPARAQVNESWKRFRRAEPFWK